MRTAFAFATAWVMTAVALAVVVTPFYAGRTVEAFVAGFLAATIVGVGVGLRLWRHLRRLMRDA